MTVAAVTAMSVFSIFILNCSCRLQQFRVNHFTDDSDQLASSFIRLATIDECILKEAVEVFASILFEIVFLRTVVVHASTIFLTVVTIIITFSSTIAFVVGFIVRIFAEYVIGGDFLSARSS